MPPAALKGTSSASKLRGSAGREHTSAYQFTCERRGGYLMAKEGDAITRTDVLAAAGDLRQAADQLKENTQALAEIGSEDREVMRIAGGRRHERRRAAAR